MKCPLSPNYLFWALLTFFSLNPLAYAGPYNVVVTYGDSLSDNGNLFSKIGIPAAPYYQGRRSDGPVAVEKLASYLQVPLVDFAWVGATTGVGGYEGPGSVGNVTNYNLIPGMTTQYNLSSASLNPYLGSGLFVVWGGPNDLLAPSPLDGGIPANIMQRAVANELAIITGLQSLGAKSILAPGMPDLGLTPSFISSGKAKLGTDFANGFNALLLASLPKGVMFFDTAGLIRSVVNNPSAYGFTNVSAPCYDGISVCANPSQYLFFDDFHPTTAAHAIIAQGFLAAVPEPPTLLLMGFGVVLLCPKRRRS